MIVGDFEFECHDEGKSASVRKKHEAFYLDADDVYHLEFIIQEIKRKMKL